MGKAGKETKGPGVAGEGDSWRTVSNREAPGRPPVPRAASDSPCSFLQILPAPPHTGVAGQADAQGKAWQRLRGEGRGEESTCVGMWKVGVWAHVWMLRAELQ